MRKYLCVEKIDDKVFIYPGTGMDVKEGIYDDADYWHPAEFMENEDVLLKRVLELLN